MLASVIQHAVSRPVLLARVYMCNFMRFNFVIQLAIASEVMILGCYLEKIFQYFFDLMNPEKLNALMAQIVF